MPNTIYGRAESNNKIQIGELALLYHFNDGQLVDWTNLLISRFLYQAKRAKGAIVLGGFVTRNDERLGVFNRSTTNLPVVEGWPTTINVDYLIGMHLLRRHKLLGLREVDQKRGSIPQENHHIEPDPKNTLKGSIPQENHHTEPDPKNTLKDQIAVLQRQMERMEKQMGDMFFYMQRHLPHHTP